MLEDAALRAIEAWESLGFNAQRALFAIVSIALLAAAMALGE